MTDDNTFGTILKAIQQNVGGCREEDHDIGLGLGGKCWEPAEFVIWGKLSKPEALGPRCYKHAEHYIGARSLAPRSNYALVNLVDLTHDIVDALND